MRAALKVDATVFALLIALASPSALILAQGLTGPLSLSTIVINTTCVVRIGIILVAIRVDKANLLEAVWGCLLVGAALAWALCLALCMPDDGLRNIVLRDPDTRVNVQVCSRPPHPAAHFPRRACAHFLTCARGHAYSQISYLALGTVHATLTSRSLRWKIAFGAIGLIITLVGDSLALCLRLGDPSLWRLPAINVCVPFIAGFAVAQAVRRGQQRPSAKLGNSERHALSARSATEVGITSHTMTTAADGATSDAHVKAEQSFGGGFWQGVVWLASGA